VPECKEEGGGVKAKSPTKLVESLNEEEKEVRLGI